MQSVEGTDKILSKRKSIKEHYPMILKKGRFMGLWGLTVQGKP